MYITIIKSVYNIMNILNIVKIFESSLYMNNIIIEKDNRVSQWMSEWNIMEYYGVLQKRLVKNEQST